MRERFITNVVCPNCKQKGAAVWEDNEDPVYRRGQWSTTLTRVSEGFRSDAAGKIYCIACGVEAVVPQSKIGP